MPKNILYISDLPMTFEGLISQIQGVENFDKNFIFEVKKHV